MSTLFKGLLGQGFDALPEPVRRFHTLAREQFTGGRSTITAPNTIGANLLAFVAGLPAPGENVDTFVRFSPLAHNREFWRRDFAGRRYESVMEASPDGWLIEHFGLFDLYFRLIANTHGLLWSLQEWRLFKIPLPKFATPTIECFESADADAFAFDIDVVFPIIGQVVHYSGVLREAPDSAPVLLYDGVCALCSRSVRYVFEHEITPSIRFVAMQSSQGREIAAIHGVDASDPQSFLFLENRRATKKSDAVLALARQLRGHAGIAFLLRVLPRDARDRLYDLIARNRYQWFGRQDRCVAPDAGARTRFVLPD
jgi:predicted DCC family thiol-disulfide oxidoreductase YuxK